jgi:hypothetical protein
MKVRAYAKPVLGYLGAIIIGGILAVVLAPNLYTGGTTLPRGIVNNLRLLEGAMQSLALDHGYTTAATATTNDLAPYIKDGGVRPVDDEEYALRAFPQSPEARLTHAIGAYRKGTLIRLGTNGGMEIVRPK